MVTIKCGVCSEDHATVFHRRSVNTNQPSGESKQDSTPNVVTKCTQACGLEGVKSCSKIFLVRVAAKKAPSNQIETYAIIDEHSSRSLISPDLISLLGVDGESKDYLLSTCTALDMPSKGRVIYDTVLTSYDNHTKEELPPLIEVGVLPHDPDEIPTPEIAAAWPHLSDIVSKMPTPQPSIKVGLLIGRDCPRLHKVRQFINGPDSAPWAQKLDLGWSIIGETCPSVKQVKP